MALIERLLPGHESRIPTDYFASMLQLWITGDRTVAQIKTNLSLDTSEGDELDELIAEAPAAISGLTGLLSGLASITNLPRTEWVARIRSILVIVEMGGVSGYETASDVRTLFGLS
jgi:hypothetical protein